MIACGSGNIGHGEDVDELSTPEAVAGLTSVVVRSISGEYHALAVSESGAVYSFGWAVLVANGNGCQCLPSSDRIQGLTRTGQDAKRIKVPHALVKMPNASKVTND